MGLFNYFRGNKPELRTDKDGTQIEVPRELFIEESDPEIKSAEPGSNGHALGIDAVYAFLQLDYEPRGYNDALTNPDESYKKDNILLIKQDLNILIERVRTQYEDKIRKIDFHIESRSRAGLVDLVQELNSEREMYEEHLSKMKEIQNGEEVSSNLVQRIILSYQRGFMKGLYAITHSTVLNGKH